MIEALADGAVKAGLSRSMALTLALKTMLGTAKLLLDQQQQMHPSQLKDAVASPSRISSSHHRSGSREERLVTRWNDHLWTGNDGESGCSSSADGNNHFCHESCRAIGIVNVLQERLISQIRSFSEMNRSIADDRESAFCPVNFTSPTDTTQGNNMKAAESKGTLRVLFIKKKKFTIHERVWFSHYKSK